MDPRFPVCREEIYSLQMELKQVQCSQNSQAERILRLEKRNIDDAALKSVWNSPFPGVIGGTPQQGPVQMPHSSMFDDADEQGEQLLGSLHLPPAEDEPVRRAVASRANSVRFDESALHGPSWAGQTNRQSGDFGPIRPGSGLLMERSSSHKSDGRHSSAGHSIHSHHSGRASSLGLETNFPAAEGDGRSFEIPAPPVSLFVLGAVPSIVRCWLTTKYAHDTLLYADICTGSQKSTVDYSLIKELNLVDELERDVDGLLRARLSVYLAEAVISQHNSRPGVAAGSVPSMSVSFEVTGADQPGQSGDRKAIRIYIGSDALRAHSADVLFSQNKMVLLGTERDHLQVPFVRPEDDSVFRHICTANMVPEKPKLNANAMPFVLAGRDAANGDLGSDDALVPGPDDDNEARRPISPPGSHTELDKPSPAKEVATAQDTGGEKPGPESQSLEMNGKDGSDGSDQSRRESSATTSSGIWTSWRQGGPSGAEGTPLSGYQPAARGGRSMKVLRPQKASSVSSRTVSSFENMPSVKAPENRRRSQAGASSDVGGTGGGGGGANGVGRWEAKRTPSSVGTEVRPPASRSESRSGGTLPRASNPVGVASAFSWMTPPGKNSKQPSASATSSGD